MCPFDFEAEIKQEKTSHEFFKIANARIKISIKHIYTVFYLHLLVYDRSTNPDIPSLLFLADA